MVDQRIGVAGRKAQASRRCLGGQAARHASGRSIKRGISGLRHRSRAPALESAEPRPAVQSAHDGTRAHQLPDQIERLIVASKKDKPHWGARKIRELLVRKLPGDVRLPAKSTVHAVLDRHGLVQRARQRRRCRAQGTELSQAAQPNDLWCTDFKGEFRLGDRRSCYRLTVTDQASRYLLMCEALESTREGPVIEAFVRLFRQRGLPHAIRSDNGCLSPDPTASTTSLSCRSSGSGSALPSNASGPAIPSRMAVTSACT